MLHVLVLIAALPSAEPPSAASTPPALAAIAAKMKDVRSLQADVVQHKRLAALEEDTESRGSLILVRPRRLRLDLSGPGGSTLIVDGDTMLTHYKALNRTDRVNLARDPRARAVADHLFLLLEGDPGRLSALYVLTVVSERPLQVRLAPRAEALRAIVKQIDTRFDAQGFATHLVVTEANGDSTEWRFSHARTNQPVPDSSFVIGTP